MKDIFSNYENLQKIGIGSYGAVYKAKQNILKSEVALKIIILNQLEGISSTALREISILKFINSLNHKNIVKLLDVAMNNEKIYIVMELHLMDLSRFILGKIPQNKFIPPLIEKKFLY